jgi:hypothetical protein
MNIDICKKCKDCPDYFLINFRRVISNKQISFGGIIEKDECTMIGCSFSISYDQYLELFGDKEKLIEKAKNPLEILNKVKIKHCAYNFEHEVIDEYRDM